LLVIVKLAPLTPKKKRQTPLDVRRF